MSIDPYNPPTISTAQITVGNVRPRSAALTAPTGQVPQSGTVNISASFTDAGTHDTHTATVDWGDTTTSARDASPRRTAPGSLAGIAHVRRPRPVHDHRDADATTTAASRRRPSPCASTAPPTANAGGPVHAEPKASTRPRRDRVRPRERPAHHELDVHADRGGPGHDVHTRRAPSTLTPTVTCNDDAVLSAQLSANDSINPTVTSDTTVTINNVAPGDRRAQRTAGPDPDRRHRQRQRAVPRRRDARHAHRDASTGATRRRRTRRSPSRRLRHAQRPRTPTRTRASTRSRSRCPTTTAAPTYDRAGARQHAADGRRRADRTSASRARRCC